MLDRAIGSLVRSDPVIPGSDLGEVDGRHERRRIVRLLCRCRGLRLLLCSGLLLGDVGFESRCWR